MQTITKVNLENIIRVREVEEVNPHDPIKYYKHLLPLETRNYNSINPQDSVKYYKHLLPQKVLRNL